MPVEIIDCDQNSDRWRQARLGIPTASEFATIMAKGRDGGASKTRATYMRKLVGERLTGEPSENYTNAHMERGHEMEDDARRAYSLVRNVDTTRVGFIRNGDKGCSPDSLIGDSGILELKTALPHILIEKIIADDFPPEHKAQCQGQLWVTGRDWVDIAVYWPKLPVFIKRAFRDEGYIANLAGAVAKFNEELEQVLDTVRRYGGLGEHAPLLMAG
jgi:hypothetical protein